VERRTYVSTKDKFSNIIHFHEVTVDGTTETKTIIRKLEGSNAAVLLSTLFGQDRGPCDDLLVVRQDGEILCLQGDTLNTRWTSPASTISRDTVMPDVLNHRVEFAKLTDAYTASKGLLRGHSDVLAAFSEPISATGFNPAILVIITSPIGLALSSNRTLHVLTIPRKSQNLAMGRVQSVQTLLSMALPWLHGKRPNSIGEICYNLHVASGVVHELFNGCLTTFNLSESLPRIQSQLSVNGASSFLPLSSTSIITSSEESINVYHPTFRSVQASINIGSTSEPASKKQKIGKGNASTGLKGHRLVTYSPKQSIVYAIQGNNLTAFQIETRNDISGRKRAQGLLIDSLGYGFENQQDRNRVTKDIPKISLGRDMPWWNFDVEKARATAIDLDRYAMANDVEAFERIMAKILYMERDEKELADWKSTYGIKTNRDLATANGDLTTDDAASKPIPPWLWPARKSKYPEVEPFWVQYAISKIFCWSKEQSMNGEESTGQQGCRLFIIFFPHNLVHWLIETGNLNKAMIELALRKDVLELGSIPADQIVQAIVDIDPEMKTLLSLVSSTYLDASELLHAIKILMQSLEMFGASPVEDTYLLTNGEDIMDRDLETEIELEEAEADKALRMAEYNLGDGSSIRGQALSVALAKLHKWVGVSVTRALQTTWTLNEITSLIYLLRVELARGAWTSRYFDTDSTISPDENGQDEAIVVVADLLNSCIDAIGAGGWLSGDGMFVDGDQIESEGLIPSLKLEVSAALEGIEEAVYLRGLTAEMVRYGESVRKTLAGEKASGADVKGRRGARPPITLAQGEKVAMLPLGLKATQQVSRRRVGAGGETYSRSMRDIGRLKSRKVGKYSRERIVI
jgi:hypothetical protein